MPNMKESSTMFSLKLLKTFLTRSWLVVLYGGWWWGAGEQAEILHNILQSVNIDSSECRESSEIVSVQLQLVILEVRR